MHSLYRNLGSRCHNWLATLLINKPPDLYLSSFMLIRHGVVREILKYRGPFPYVDGLILRVTDNIGVVTVQHHPRAEGSSLHTWAS